MCGISGIFDLTGTRDYPRDLLQRINDIQSHRGPDEAGLHLEPGVALGHRRLSIIDSQHESGQRDFSAPLWSLLMFDAFLKNGGLAEAPKL